METSEPRKTPRQLLEELGITRPEEIDVEVIAYTCGATTRYADLTGSEATLVGMGDKAIITVREQSSRVRKRFSVGHELGHWIRDRGSVAFSCKESDLDISAMGRARERNANEFASDLLLPAYLFDPMAQGRSLDLETLRDMAERFRTSLTATSIKLVRRGSYPAVLASYKSGRRAWYIRGDSVPPKFAPLESLDRSTGAASADSDLGSEDIRADRWFDHEHSRRYEVRESWFRTTSDSVVALIWWEDEQQLLDFEEEEQDYELRRERSSWDPFERF
ncbi:MAG: ImmA/IrrE family metallo-endopeptidase [Bryobacterales bacterium]|nr:ImmA/IrrE family metallo-endopeptidase [Bryobacterales bacterium]